MVFVGVDWAEAHHDVCVIDEAGKVLGKRRVLDGLEGVRQIHEQVAAQTEQPERVVVGIETDRGLLVGARIGLQGRRIELAERVAQPLHKGGQR